MTNPWDRNAGKFDVPSSSPVPAAKNPRYSRPDRTPIYDDELPGKYQGIESVMKSSDWGNLIIKRGKTRT